MVLVVLALVLATAIGVRAVVAVPVSVEGHSMEPTVHQGDVALVSRLTDVEDGLRRGDLIVFRDPTGTLSLKRVVGVAGDLVRIRHAVLEIDERPVVEPYLDQTHVSPTYFGPVTVPARSVFVLGDNRVSSIDSRDYGAVDAHRVLGRVLFAW